MDKIEEFKELLEFAYNTIAELHTRIAGLELEQLELQADIEKYKNFKSEIKCFHQVLRGPFSI